MGHTQYIKCFDKYKTFVSLKKNRQQMSNKKQRQFAKSIGGSHCFDHWRVRHWQRIDRTGGPQFEYPKKSPFSKSQSNGRFGG